MLGAAAAAAAIVPIAGISALTATQAGATLPGIKCSAGTGSVFTSPAPGATINLSGCTGNTGGSGSTTSLQTDTKGTIVWNTTGKKPKKTSYSLKYATGTKCAAAGLGTVADEVLKGSKVVSDTTKDTAVGAAVKAELCIDPDGSGGLEIQLVPGTKFSIAG